MLIEKPLASTLEECKALIELADKRDLILMPGHTFLYSPPVVRVKELPALGSLAISTSVRQAE